jgi:phosphoglycerol transferase MdoB-like AlkP superfamily enzyme
MFSVLLAYGLTSLLVQQAQTHFIALELRTSKRCLKLWLIQSASIAIIFLSALIISNRPFLSAIISLAFSTIFLVVNQAKYKALNEPLVFSDVYLYLQVFTHPRLFLPFLNIPLTIIAVIAGLALLYLAILLEPALTISSISLLLGVSILIIALSLFTYRTASEINLSFSPNEDIRQLGFFNSLLIYSLQAKQKNHLNQLYTTIASQSPYETIVPQQNQAYPDLITIQSESFFDARYLNSKINPKVLQHFDLITKQALKAGRLQVPAWGANTLRSEYAFLSSIDNEELKYYRFNPYQFLQKQSSPTLASYLKNLGYHCICIHPNHSMFFKRDKVFPLFGFDEFIDIDEFDSNQTTGPYISDQAVKEKILEAINNRKDSRPIFIFAITMENHGPLHLENYTESILTELYTAQPPAQHHDLSIYLKHLKNADQMLFDLTNALRARPAETLVCWYGDHVPSMPDIYRELNFKDGRSDYLIWSNKHSALNQATELDIEDLGLSLLNLAGITVANKS